MTDQDRDKHREAMARIGLLYSVSVMHMLSSGAQTGSWPTRPFGCLEHHILPDQVLYLNLVFCAASRRKITS